MHNEGHIYFEMILYYLYTFVILLMHVNRSLGYFSVLYAKVKKKKRLQ